MTPTLVFLTKEVPTRDNLRPFGQRVMIHIYKDQRDSRWAPRAQEAQIIGYTETHGVYQVITPTGKRLISKNPRPIKEIPEESNPEVPPKTPTELIPEKLPGPTIGPLQEYGILPHSRTYYCLLFSLYHMFIIFVISY